MIQSIIFDFDGVVIDSMPIKDRGYELLFADFDKTAVDKLVEFHKKKRRRIKICEDTPYV
ncbi:hypothetical protein [Seleniivibrio sp.]|uniref:hypothetical protein n=1 Tax=Seleniivibrio sp. TaxID=2898801 RepID=UPI0025DB4F1F|nr:hypothetical protein [Seleniivibrio sp.]MCD8554096.1 hypothetical protein [Seleniivibrio sp.]